jgi:hypothetical protein
VRRPAKAAERPGAAWQEAARAASPKSVSLVEKERGLAEEKKALKEWMALGVAGPLAVQVRSLSLARSLAQIERSHCIRKVI